MPAAVLPHLVMKTENIVVDAYFIELHESLDRRENVKHLECTSHDEARENQNSCDGEQQPDTAVTSPSHPTPAQA